MDRAYRRHNHMKLVSEERHKELPPGQTLQSSGFCRGEVCADIGCGNGFFSLPMADIVGESGKVYALDIDRDMLDELLSRSSERQRTIITALQSEPYSLPLESELADRALLSNILHEVDHPEQLLKESLRILKPGGDLYVIEWSYKETVHGPDLSRRISEERIIEYLKDSSAEIADRREVSASHTMYHIQKRSAVH